MIPNVKNVGGSMLENVHCATEVVYGRSSHGFFSVVGTHYRGFEDKIQGWFIKGTACVPITMTPSLYQSEIRKLLNISRFFCV